MNKYEGIWNWTKKSIIDFLGIIKNASDAPALWSALEEKEITIDLHSNYRLQYF